MSGTQSTPRSPHQSLAVNVMIRGRGHRVAFALPGGQEKGGRQLFLVPWRERLMIGTGHYAKPGDGSPVRTVEQAVERFLEEINRALPGEQLSREDVVLVHQGLVPVREDPLSKGIRFLKRPLVIDHGRSGIPWAISVFTGKFTIARWAAELAVNRVVARLGRSFGPCTTSRVRLPGAPDQPVEEVIAAARARDGGATLPDVLEHLVRSYGQRYHRILDLARLPKLNERAHPDSPVIRAQWVHAVQHEMAIRPEDLVWRRTELGARGLAGAEVLRRARQIFEPEDGEETCRIP